MRPSIKANGSHIRKQRLIAKKKTPRVVHVKPQLAKHGLRRG